MDRDQDAGAALEPTTLELSLRDGRTLTYCLYGPNEGVPMLFHYGTPGIRLLSPGTVGAAVRHGTESGSWSQTVRAMAGPAVDGADVSLTSSRTSPS